MPTDIRNFFGGHSSFKSQNESPINKVMARYPKEKSYSLHYIRRSWVMGSVDDRVNEL